MTTIPLHKRKMTPEKAQRLLKQHGTEVTAEEAQLILDFMYKLGALSVDQYVKIAPAPAAVAPPDTQL